ncbi:ABC transporter ATP-binding protein [Caldalkalibacillus mannanilyticus]|uniref:ABC transporter ATP-binding protein n=1 Tax=Caldalkalibacillus mannanilyticus TaxID=1418 RepID=UPI00046A1F9A|nr:ABC transporter ATP-binding protein [Caldalkalibacillus mannanilyticus]
MAKNLVEFRHLKTYFYTEAGVVQAVNDVSFSIREGETIGIVGESGCGKSITAMSLMRLIPSPPGKIEAGEILFEGKNLLSLREEEIRIMRSKEFAMIFQEPMSSLNPVLTIGDQIMEPLLEHLYMSKKEARLKAIDLIKQVGIPRAEEIMHSYPHELSGGMRQRVMIAIALSCDPKLLIADEPTTALDVTIQAQILELLKEIKEKRNMSLMLITHDLGVIAEMADYVVVMYAGKVIEEAPVRELFRNPRHPYTKGLLEAKPIIGKRKDRLYTIPGQVPNPIGLGDYCHFSERCEFCMDICREEQPVLKTYESGNKVACWLEEKGGAGS